MPISFSLSVKNLNFWVSHTMALGDHVIFRDSSRAEVLGANDSGRFRSSKGLEKIFYLIKLKMLLIVKYIIILCITKKEITVLTLWNFILYLSKKLL